MFKMTISKIKKLCSVALILRILRDEMTLSPRKLGKRPLDGFWKMAKSTDSKDTEAECEKCKKLIEMVFGRDKPENLLKQVEANIEDIQMDKIQKVIAPNITVNEKSDDNSNLIAIENPKKELETEKNISAERTKEPIAKNPVNQTVLPLSSVLQSTTAKTNEEKLAQKLETIEEPGIVGSTTPKIEGFNTPPRVLGDQDKLLESNNSLCTKIGPEEDAMDKIAKKCLDAPPDKIDERILEEMKNCGMLGRSRKKPTFKKCGYHAMKYNDKESLLGTKSEQSALHYKNQHKNNSAINNYLRYHNMKYAHNPQNIYPAYFKNVPLGLFGDGHFGKKMNEHKITTQEHKEEKVGLEDIKTKAEGEKPLLIPSGHSVVENKTDEHKITTQEYKEEIVGLEDVKTIAEGEKPLLLSSVHSIVESDKKNTVTNDPAGDKTEISEEVVTRTITTEKGKPKEIIENVEVEVEEIRVTAAETSHLGLPGETEIEPDFNNKHTKPEIIPCHDVLQTAETPIDANLIEPNKHENVVLASSNSKHPTDWHFRPDLPERPFLNPNTAISSTFPVIKKQDQDIPNLETSISAKQNPDEYFDLSHCNMEEVNIDDVTTLSEIRPLAAYHQYTIFTGTEETEESVKFSIKHTPEVSHVSELKLDPQIKNEDLHKTINKDISTAMGPLPQLKDLEEELSLSELLRRVRERNRLQYCRECAFKAVEAEPIEANKCPPPLEKGPSKTLGPGPCKPKPKPACPPPPPSCPPPAASPCKPKNPCAKFSKTSIIGDRIKEAFTLVLQVALKPAFASPRDSSKSKPESEEPLRQVLDDKDATRIEKLGNFLLSSCPESKQRRFAKEDVILARDYEPWSPIPSWPIPKKEKKGPFVCPKEGCKIIPPPRLNAPCKENPCITLPKRTFSLLDFEYEPLYLYKNEL